MDAKMDLEFKKRWLQWILNFVQSDLNSISKSKFRGLCVEVSYFSCLAFLNHSFEKFLAYSHFDKLPEIQIDNFNELVVANVRKEVDYSQRLPRLKESTTPEHLEDVISEISTEVSNIQKALKGFLEESQGVLVEPKMEIDDEGIGHPIYAVFLPETENRLQRDSFLGQGAYFWNMYIVPKSYSRRDWATLNFARLMDGVNIKAIKRCAGCGRNFLNASRREKIYCNSSCASRSIAHKKYENLKKDQKKYEAHLKKYRKLSRERYKKLRQLQYGPNVKIQRRRNNRKEG